MARSARVPQKAKPRKEGETPPVQTSAGISSRTKEPKSTSTLKRRESKMVKPEESDVFTMETPSAQAAFTGERYLPNVQGPIQYEHFHRYMVLRGLCADKDVLDIACGDGYGSNFLAIKAKSVIGVDIDLNAVTSAETRYVRQNLKFVQGSATDIPLLDASVDVVVSYETLEHMLEQEAFLKECRRVLRPNGVLVMSTPDTEVFSPPGSEPNPYHLKELTRGEFEQLIDSHFNYSAFLGQSPVFGSVIAPLDDHRPVLEFLDEKAQHTYQRQTSLVSPTYIIAIASDAPVEDYVFQTANLLNGSFSGLPEWVRIAVNASKFEQEVVRLNEEVIHREKVYHELAQELIDVRSRLQVVPTLQNNVQRAQDEGAALQQQISHLTQLVADQGGLIDRQRQEIQQLEQRQNDLGVDHGKEIDRLNSALAANANELANLRSAEAALLEQKASLDEKNGLLLSELDVALVARHAAQSRLDAIEEAYKAVLHRDAEELMHHRVENQRLIARSLRLEREIELVRAEVLSWEAEKTPKHSGSALDAARSTGVGETVSDLDVSSGVLAQGSSPQQSVASDTDSRSPDEMKTELAIAREEAFRAQSALREEEAQSRWLSAKVSSQGEQAAAMDRALRSLTAELATLQRVNQEIRSSTTWIMARALFRLLSFSPPPLRALGRRILLYLAGLIGALRSRRENSKAVLHQDSTHVARTPSRTIHDEFKPTEAMSGASTSSSHDVRPIAVEPEVAAFDSTAGSKLSVIIALDDGVVPGEAMLANLSGLMPGAELLVSAKGAPKLKHGITVPALPDSTEQVRNLDNLIRASANPWVVLLTEEVALTSAAVNAIETTFLTWQDAVGANGLITSDQNRQHKTYREKSTRSIEYLQPGICIFDVDSYSLVGGLLPEPGGLAAALGNFSERAQHLGFHVIRNPSIEAKACGRTTSTRLPDLSPEMPVVRNGRTLRALICDLVTPMPDRDCGSLNLVWNIRILQRLGYDITFLPTWERGHAGRYTDDLRSMGVLCPLAEDYAEPWQFLADAGAGFDLVVLFRVGCACHTIGPVKEFAPQARVVFNTVDLHFLREDRAAELSDSDVMRRNAEATRREELNVMRVVDATTVVSTYEKQLLAEMLPDAQVHCIPIVNPVGGLMGSAAGRSGIMFVGGFAHSPNKDGVLYFLQEIWPKVHALVPDQKLYIIGSNPPPEVLAFHSDENMVSIEGFVDNLGPWYEKIRVNIAPLRFGGGVKGKIISSLSVGLPTVGTSIAIEGMELTDGKNVLLADDPVDFAAHIAKLCTDDDLWDEMARNSVSIAREIYSVEAVDRGTRLMLGSLGLPH